MIFMMVTLQGCEHLDVYSVEGYRPIILSPDHAPAPMLDRTYAFVCEKDQEHYTMFPAGGMKGPWYRLDYEGEIIEMSPEEIQAFLDRQPEGIQFKPIYKTPF